MLRCIPGRADNSGGAFNDCPRYMPGAVLCLSIGSDVDGGGNGADEAEVESFWLGLEPYGPLDASESGASDAFS